MADAIRKRQKRVFWKGLRTTEVTEGEGGRKVYRNPDLWEFRGGDALTISLGDSTRDNPACERLGRLLDRGFSREDLDGIRAHFEAGGARCELLDLRERLPPELRAGVPAAFVLVVRGGMAVLLEGSGKTHEDAMDEQRGLEYDRKHYTRYRRVVNKLARFNVCFSTEDRAPQYDERRGTVVDYRRLEVLGRLVARIREIECCDLEWQGEGNYYYDAENCGIAYHGDGQRRKVIGMRMGLAFPLHFQWYRRSAAVGENLRIPLEAGDMYVMEQGATGFNAHDRGVAAPVLMHAAGAAHYVVPWDSKAELKRKRRAGEA